MTEVHRYGISILRSVFTSNHSRNGQRENKMKIKEEQVNEIKERLANYVVQDVRDNSNFGLDFIKDRIEIETSQLKTDTEIENYKLLEIEILKKVLNELAR